MQAPDPHYIPAAVAVSVVVAIVEAMVCEVAQLLENTDMEMYMEDHISTIRQDAHHKFISPSPTLTWCNLPFLALSCTTLQLQRTPFLFLMLKQELVDCFLKLTLGVTELHTTHTTPRF